jgi:carboxyl-terminal processing protease
MSLWVLLAACGSVAPDPAAETLARLQAQRPLLRAAESELVQERLRGAEARQNVVEVQQALVLARRLGLDVPAETAPTVAPVDARASGVTQAHGKAVLDGVRNEYRVAVDETKWGDAAGRVLGTQGAEGPEAAIREAVLAGMEESAAVVQGVEAALISLDPYTQAVWPAQVAQWTAHHDGVRVGVGMSVDARGDGRVVVTGLEPAGPAFAEGLHQGDVLVSVDGVDVHGLADARARLAGLEASTVELVVLRQEETVRASLVRAAVPEQTVFGWQRRPDHGFDPLIEPGVGLARISAFRGNTDEAVVELVGEGPWQAFVLDLRGNGGGDVQAALNVLDQWLDDGLLVQMDGRAAPVPEPPGEGEAAWNEATPGGALRGVCTAVLVDEETASAAEIVAGVLQQRGAATVFGATTTGKGSSQALRADEALGVAWQVTNLAWALPDGRVLTAGNGIVPDVVHEPTPAESWQTARLAAIREAPRVHADGTPMTWLGPGVADGLVALDGDPMLTRALVWIQEKCR